MRFGELNVMSNLFHPFFKILDKRIVRVGLRGCASRQSEKCCLLVVLCY
jgi:hypothetical protein